VPHQLPDFSWAICQRPSFFVMMTVLLLLLFRTSERYDCLKVTVAWAGPVIVTLGVATATEIDLGAAILARRAFSHSGLGSPPGVLNSLA
jgi:hypothetical protein